jgi:hypothetical protein
VRTVRASSRDLEHGQRLAGDDAGLGVGGERDKAIADGISVAAVDKDVVAVEPAECVPAGAGYAVEVVDVCASPSQQRGVVASRVVGRPGVGHGDEGVDAGGLGVDAPGLRVPGDRSGDGPVAQLGERGPFGGGALADVGVEGDDDVWSPIEDRGEGTAGHWNALTGQPTRERDVLSGVEVRLANAEDHVPYTEHVVRSASEELDGLGQSKVPSHHKSRSSCFFYLGLVAIRFRLASTLAAAHAALARFCARAIPRSAPATRSRYAP